MKKYKVEFDSSTTAKIRKSRHPFDFGSFFVETWKSGKQVQGRKNVYEKKWNWPLFWSRQRWFYYQVIPINLEWQFRYAFGALGLVLFLKTLNPLFLGFMGAVAFDSATSGSRDSTGNNFTFTHTAAGDNRIAMFGDSVDGNVAVSTLTYAGTGATFQTNTNGATDRRAELWFLASPSTATDATVSVTTASNIANICGCSTFTGSDGTISGTLTNTGGGAAGTSSSIDVTSTASDYVFDVLCLGASKAPAPGVGQTERWDTSTADHGGSGSDEAGGVTVTMSWSFTSSFFGHIACSIDNGTQVAAVVNNWLLMGV